MRREPTASGRATCNRWGEFFKCEWRFSLKGHRARPPRRVTERLDEEDLPASTIPEFAALLKTNGAKMQYGSAGAGTTTHLACAMLNSVIGANVTHVPYRGSAPASNDLIGGQIDYLCGNLGAATPLITGKQVKAIAVLSRARSPLMPDLPSAPEQGLNGLDITTWTAIFLPKGAPKAVVDKLNEVTHATMETPAIKNRMLEIGVTGVAPDRRSPEYLAKFVADEIARWGGITGMGYLFSFRPGLHTIATALEETILPRALSARMPPRLRPSGAICGA
jgi:hypothetical protein